jgi:hypothetical protein
MTSLPGVHCFGASSHSGKVAQGGRPESNDEGPSLPRSVNLHAHAHVLVMDGVFAEADGGALAFHELPAPSCLELQRPVLMVH